MMCQLHEPCAFEAVNRALGFLDAEVSVPGNLPQPELVAIAEAQHAKAFSLG